MKTKVILCLCVYTGSINQARSIQKEKASIFSRKGKNSLRFRKTIDKFYSM